MDANQLKKRIQRLIGEAEKEGEVDFTSGGWQYKLIHVEGEFNSNFKWHMPMFKSKTEEKFFGEMHFSNGDGLMEFLFANFKDIEMVVDI